MLAKLLVGAVGAVGAIAAVGLQPCEQLGDGTMLELSAMSYFCHISLSPIYLSGYIKLVTLAKKDQPPARELATVSLFG
jgi:hypothetical protein